MSFRRTATRGLASLLSAGLILAALPAFGIVHAQCTGTATAVECTGVDPDGWNAGVEAPGAITDITIQPGALVLGSIVTEGDDALTIASGAALSVTAPVPAGALVGVHATNDRNSVHIEGALETTGGGRSDGVLVEGDQNTVTVDGTLTASATVFAHGIDAEGDQNTVHINGTLHVASDGSHNVTYGAHVGGSDGQIVNTGSITTACTGSDCSSAGLTLSGSGGQVHNGGTITSTATSALSNAFGAAGIASSAAGARVTNSGTISVEVGPGSLAAEGISLSGTNSQVINTGTISATSARVTSGVALYGAGERLVNSGTITSTGSAVWAGSGGQSVTNSGTLNGAVFLGGGDDSFTAEDGAVNGLLDGGADFDTLTFAFDVLDVDYAALAAQIAAASPAGGSLSYGGATYTWINFEQLINLLSIVASSGGGEVVVSLGGIHDGRLNGLDLAATAIVYPLPGGGVELYTPQGDWAFNADAESVIAALAEAAASGTAVEIDARLGLTLSAQPDGSLFATGPHGYTFTFQPGQCGIDLPAHEESR